MVTTVQRNRGGRGGNKRGWGESNRANSAVEIGRRGKGFAHTAECAVPQGTRCVKCAYLFFNLWHVYYAAIFQITLRNIDILIAVRIGGLKKIRWLKYGHLPLNPLINEWCLGGGIIKSAYYSDDFTQVGVIILLHRMTLVGLYDVKQ